MESKFETGLTVEAWAEITVKEWITKAAALGVSPTDPINLDRFTHHVITSSNGDPQRVEFAFDYFLYFVDWGVGSGVTLENRDAFIASGFTSRRPKPFITDVFYKQVKILAHLMKEKYAQQAALLIASSIQKRE